MCELSDDYNKNDSRVMSFGVKLPRFQKFDTSEGAVSYIVYTLNNSPLLVTK